MKRHHSALPDNAVTRLLASWGGTAIGLTGAAVLLIKLAM